VPSHSLNAAQFPTGTLRTPTFQLPPISEKICFFLSWILLGVGVATMALTVMLVVYSYSPVMYVDHWAFTYQLIKGKANMWDFGPAHDNIWAILWAQHNGHRIVFPKLFYLADLFVFGGRNIFLRILNYTLQVFQLFVFGYLLCRQPNISGNTRRSAFGVAAFCLFCPAQRDVFMSGWEVAYVLPFVCATAAFAFLAFARRLETIRIWPCVAIAWIFAVVGSFSLASGFLIWPVLLAEIVAFRLPKKIFLATAGLTVLFAGVNLIGYKAPTNTDFKGALRHPDRVVSFCFQIMCSAWTDFSYPAGVVLALAGLLICFGLLFRDILVGKPDHRLRVALSCTGVYMALTVFLTGVTRWNLGFAGRYEAGALAFWCVCAIGIYTFVGNRWLGRGLIAVQLVTCSIMISGAKQIQPLMQEAKTRKQYFHMAEVALVAKVNDQTALSLVSPPQWSMDSLDFLSKHHLSLYSTTPASMIGKQLMKNYSIHSDSCSGAVQTVLPVSDARWPGIAVSGWAWRDRAGAPIMEVLFTGNNGTIIGIGSSDLLIKDHKGQPAGRAANATWKGFLPLSAQSQTIRVYGIDSSKSVCSLNGGTPVDVGQALRASAR
jgi:hypothetical protein